MNQEYKDVRVKVQSLPKMQIINRYSENALIEDIKNALKDFGGNHIKIARIESYIEVYDRLKEEAERILKNDECE